MGRRLLTRPRTKWQATNAVHMYCHLYFHVIIPFHSSKTSNFDKQDNSNVFFYIILYVQKILVLREILVPWERISHL